MNWKKFVELKTPNYVILLLFFFLVWLVISVITHRWIMDSAKVDIEIRAQEKQIIENEKAILNNQQYFNTLYHQMIKNEERIIKNQEKIMQELAKKK